MTPIETGDPAGFLDDTDKAIIDELQRSFPVDERPFASVAHQFGLNEEGLIARLARLLEEGTLTRFGPLYHAERLGGGLTLAAIAVPQARFDEVTGLVNAFPEVAHNYAREHRLNMWFVLATDTPERIAEVIAAIEQATGLKVFNVPKQAEFYVGLHFDLLGRGDRPLPEPRHLPYDVDETDRALVRATQSGLPLVPRPYDAVAEETGLSSALVMARLQAMLEAGVIRRIGAVPNHYRLGYRANGMTVWDIPDERVKELGPRVGALGFVSHCYQRPRHLPEWPYNLFAMVHGRDAAEVEEKTEQIAGLLGEADRGHLILYSSRILKKTGLRIA